ncbi:hypothetical protein QYM36_012067 [Artemia franciscana]|uniref:Reverse transcriptase domain-containing protein n=1 Tax=Artemia franciscana TaxID=6661 RepID=A0AA88HKT9_ARTSF|nr:hypothetical protein QYM36_012067 [Artemia franciscana]
MHVQQRGKYVHSARSQTILKGSVAATKTNGKDEALVPLTLDNQLSVNFKIDTGAQANVIPKNIFDQLDPKPNLQSTNQRLTSYWGTRIPVIGTCDLTCSHKQYPRGAHRFYVVNSTSTPIVGYRSSIDLNVIKLVLNVNAEQTSIEEKYKSLFECIGQLEGECNIHLKEGSILTVYPARRVPEALKDKLQDEPNRMERDGIIEKVTEPTEWVNSMVMIEKKNGTVRLCIDPVDLHKCIRRPYYPIPTLEDVTAKLHGAKVFSKMDARSGYWSLVLSATVSEMTTFSTIYGRYRFLRMPFGLLSAQDEFQCRMEEAFEGLEGVAIIIDDILVYGANQEEHDERLQAVMERALKKGVKFNKDKCSISASSVCYFGHVIGADGMKPDSEKVRAIEEMPRPQSREELLTLLGMLNYLTKYVPDLSTRNKSLRDILQCEPFSWSPENDQTLAELKQSIVSGISFFNYKNLNVELKVDASSHGFGANLCRDGEVVAYTSCTLSKTEQKYSQLEKELYAIVYGCKHFHHYLYGRRVNVITDQRPLETIVRNPIHKAPPRVQRLMLQLQPYDLHLQFRPGSEIPIADAFSRLHLPDIDEKLATEIDVYVHQISRHLPQRHAIEIVLGEAMNTDPTQAANEDRAERPSKNTDSVTRVRMVLKSDR